MRRNWKKQPTAPTSTGSTALKTAIYARVSTFDQDCAMQLAELATYCKGRAWPVAGEYIDKGISGAAASRPALDKLKAQARKRAFDCVVVWKIDRWGRSLIDCINGIRELSSLGIRFISVTQNIDTDESNPASRLMMSMLFAFAEFERELIQERIRAGVAQHKRNVALNRYGHDVHSRSGKDLPTGRPKRIFNRAKALEMRQAKISWRRIAEELDVPVGTLRDAIGKLSSNHTPPEQAQAV
jgi:DNA invertase Pin-like site-specific DNA recombinase